VRVVPDDLSDDQASLVEPMAVALHGVLRRPPHDGDRALVIGAGIIGLLMAHCVKLVAPACRLTVVARYPHQAEAARRAGADEILGGGDLYPQVAQQTGGRLYRAMMNRGMILGGYDVVYDCVGHSQTVLDALRWTRARGAVVLVGIDLALLKIDLNPVWYQEVDLIGSHTFGAEHTDDGTRHTFELVIDHLRAGRLRTDGLITHRFPLAEYRRAIATALHKRSGAIKVTFVP
jgi:threonine dehydrogenase-like Zn-dependent dehydrogenase